MASCDILTPWLCNIHPDVYYTSGSIAYIRIYNLYIRIYNIHPDVYYRSGSIIIHPDVYYMGSIKIWIYIIYPDFYRSHFQDVFSPRRLPIHNNLLWYKVKSDSRSMCQMSLSLHRQMSHVVATTQWDSHRVTESQVY